MKREQEIYSELEKLQTKTLGLMQTKQQENRHLYEEIYKRIMELAQECDIPLRNLDINKPKHGIFKRAVNALALRKNNEQKADRVQVLQSKFDKIVDTLGEQGFDDLKHFKFETEDYQYTDEDTLAALNQYAFLEDVEFTKEEKIIMTENTEKNIDQANNRIDNLGEELQALNKADPDNQRPETERKLNDELKKANFDDIDEYMSTFYPDQVAAQNLQPHQTSTRDEQTPSELTSSSFTNKVQVNLESNNSQQENSDHRTKIEKNLGPTNTM